MSAGPDARTVSVGRTVDPDSWYAVKVRATTEEGAYVHEGVEAAALLIFD